MELFFAVPMLSSWIVGAPKHTPLKGTARSNRHRCNGCASLRYVWEVIVTSRRAFLVNTSLFLAVPIDLSGKGHAQCPPGPTMLLMFFSFRAVHPVEAEEIWHEIIPEGLSGGKCSSKRSSSNVHFRNRETMRRSGQLQFGRNPSGGQKGANGNLEHPGTVVRARL